MIVQTTIPIHSNPTELNSPCTVYRRELARSAPGNFC